MSRVNVVQRHTHGGGISKPTPNHRVVIWASAQSRGAGPRVRRCSFAIQAAGYARLLLRITSRSLPLYKVQQQRLNVNVSVRDRQPNLSAASVARIRVNASPVRHSRIPAASLPIKGGHRIGGSVTGNKISHIVPSTIGGVPGAVKKLWGATGGG